MLGNILSPPPPCIDLLFGRVGCDHSLPSPFLRSRTTVMQQKTHRPVQYEITERTRAFITARIDKAHLPIRNFLFASRVIDGCQIPTRQYARINASRGELIRLNPSRYTQVTHLPFEGPELLMRHPQCAEGRSRGFLHPVRHRPCDQGSRLTMRSAGSFG
jgi:hypothetical protein